jgi:DNA helicase-2/ATP-dependent DNA helicase PcrA
MISIEQFYDAYEFLNYRPDPEKQDAIEVGPDAPLFVVAGPGTGKTTCLTLRILKFIFVDEVAPDGILATTFTRKAAAELRSRILSNGFQMIEVLQEDDGISDGVKERLQKTDINQVTTGTIDSICEEILRDHRPPGTQPPIPADEYVSKTLMLRAGLLSTGLFQDDDLENLTYRLNGGTDWGWNISRKNKIVTDLWDRRFQDQVDWEEFVTDENGDPLPDRRALGRVMDSYRDELEQRGMVDFALIEQNVLNRLREGRLTEFLDGLEVVLVDEYQDTNLLQEAIYFEMADACDGALTVVGDDDQSLFRFRGATVELFREFRNRYQEEFGTLPERVELTTNYRSTQNIISFVNDYVRLDDDYQDVRVEDKPNLGNPRDSDTGEMLNAEGLPVLGLFRDNLDDLATDLASLIHSVFRDGGYELPTGDTLRADPEEGEIGDCALLCSSPREFKNNEDRDPRLPGLLRQRLRLRGIDTFNPRGEDLTRINVIRIFGGFLLECIDPGRRVQQQLTEGRKQEGNAPLLDGGTVDVFDDWRATALQFLNGDPPQGWEREVPDGLEDYAACWADRDPNEAGYEWPQEVSVLDLIYGLTHFFPELHDDPEGQVYLEAFTRQLTTCEQVGSFEGRLIHDPENPGLGDASVKELLMDFLSPIASGVVGVNEDLMDDFPRNRLSILSIHQSKGLEFPLAIVDVGSDFRTNHAGHRFKRHPRESSRTHEMENLVRPYTDLGAPDRSGQDRAFDDLYRKFFVSYSRPMEVLLLVGHSETLPDGNALNVATGWDRDQNSLWENNRPFLSL